MPRKLASFTQEIANFQATDRKFLSNQVAWSNSVTPTSARLFGWRTLCVLHSHECVRRSQCVGSLCAQAGVFVYTLDWQFVFVRLSRCLSSFERFVKHHVMVWMIDSPLKTNDDSVSFAVLRSDPEAQCTGFGGRLTGYQISTRIVAETRLLERTNRRSAGRHRHNLMIEPEPSDKWAVDPICNICHSKQRFCWSSSASNSDLQRPRFFFGINPLGIFCDRPKALREANSSDHTNQLIPLKLFHEFTVAIRRLSSPVISTSALYQFFVHQLFVHQFLVYLSLCISSSCIVYRRAPWLIKPKTWIVNRPSCKTKAERRPKKGRLRILNRWRCSNAR